LTTVSIIRPALLKRFQAKWTPVRVKKTRQIKDQATARRDQLARQRRGHRLIAATDGRLDQFTGSRPVLELGIWRQLQLDQRGHRPGFAGGVAMWMPGSRVFRISLGHRALHLSRPPPDSFKFGSLQRRHGAQIGEVIGRIRQPSAQAAIG
jgi:hypothetical protein